MNNGNQLVTSVPVSKLSFPCPYSFVPLDYRPVLHSSRFTGKETLLQLPVWVLQVSK